MDNGIWWEAFAYLPTYCADVDRVVWWKPVWRRHSSMVLTYPSAGWDTITVLKNPHTK